MSDRDFHCVFYSNFTSVMNRFRDNDVFLKTENDALEISPLESTVRSFR